NLSLFEKEILQKAINKHGLTIDTAPENKKIRSFYYYTEDPFKTSDRFVSWLNFLQFKTKDSALASQLWVHSGDVYNPNLLIENEQALLNPLVRSFALIFPVQKTDNPSKTEVDLLVVTKDIFSWQGTSSISATGVALGQLSLGFSQTNLFGHNKTVGVNFGLNQKLMSLSAYYADPSLFSTKNQLSLSQGVYLNPSNFAYEGLNTTLQLAYPLATEETPWGYTASFNYNNQPFYDFQGNTIRKYEGYDRQYRGLQISPQVVGIRSFGKTNKQNLSFGYGFSSLQYTPLETVSDSFIQNVLPISELQSFLILGYSFFQNRFLALYDYNTFIMTEWVQLGPSVSLNNQIALNPILGSDHTFYKPTLSLGASASPAKDSLLKVSSQLTTRLQDTFINNQISISAAVVLPSIGNVGRFVLGATYANLWNNKNNTFFSLGGEAGLRGAAYRYYQGNQFLRANVEFRTRSVPFWIFRFGLAGFYDFGDAFNNSSDFNPTHDVGLGLRILTVPWNRLLIRIDAATPVWGPVHGLNNTLITLGIGQAF
ncbi:MAG: hypothetical protein WCK49_08305, partial [Myxococcaceae bacterium]